MPRFGDMYLPNNNKHKKCQKIFKYYFDPPTKNETLLYGSVDYYLLDQKRGLILHL